MPTTKPPKLSASDKAFRRQAALAVLTGIYASHGEVIMQAKQGDYERALVGARRVAWHQADELLRSEGEAA
jgi:hypothetical protein